MALGDVVSGFFLNIKNDKGLLARVIIGSIITLTTFILGFAFLIRLWVYQRYPTKYAEEFIGFDQRDFTETFPQITFCPGYYNDSKTHQITQGVISAVTCNFHDITPNTHDPESTEKTDKVTPISNIRGPVPHTIDFRSYTTCFDVNFNQAQSPQIKWQDSHSYIACRVSVNTYVHVYPYGFSRTKPSHVLSHYTNIKNGEATLLSVRAEEVSDFPGTFYEIDRKDEELRFQWNHPDHLWVTFSFSRFSKRRYQAFHGAHQQTDVTLGMIGGFAFLFFFVYQLIAFIVTLFVPAAGYTETQPLVATK